MRQTLNTKLYAVCEQIGIQDVPMLLIRTREVKDIPWNVSGETVAYKYDRYGWKSNKFLFINLRKMANMKQATNTLIRALVVYRWSYLSWKQVGERVKLVLAGKRYPTEESQRQKREEWERTHPEEVSERKRKREAEKQHRREERQRRYEEYQKQQEERRRRWQQQDRERQTIGPYEVLQIPPNSPRDIVVAAYRKLVKVWHPDRNPPPYSPKWHEASEMFRKITNAYELVINWM